MSHTYAICQVSQAAFDEIRGKLKEAGYEHAFDDAEEGGPVVDMHGIALQAEPIKTTEQPELNATEGLNSATSERILELLETQNRISVDILNALRALTPPRIVIAQESNNLPGVRDLSVD